jgi:two-component system, chemotaxis family, chemotaxis protein CheY
MKELRALVVDDSQAMRRSIIYALHRIPGLVCIEAHDGADALKKFAQETFDVVLTDINMPVMDGLKLITSIRQGSTNAQVPIVVISTESAESDRQHALGLGASAYLSKPIQAKPVIDTIRQLLNLTA